MRFNFLLSQPFVYNYPRTLRLTVMLCFDNRSEFTVGRVAVVTNSRCSYQNFLIWIFSKRAFGDGVCRHRGRSDRGSLEASYPPPTAATHGEVRCVNAPVLDFRLLSHRVWHSRMGICCRVFTPTPRIWTTEAVAGIREGGQLFHGAAIVAAADVFNIPTRLVA
jgi:hypothetical protein